MTFRAYTQAHLALAFVFSWAALIWVLANYTWPSDPTRELSGRRHAPPPRTVWIIRVALRSLLAALLIGWITGRSLWIGIWTFTLGLVFPFVRSRVPAEWLAETEIAANLAFVLGYCLLVHGLAISASLPVTRWPMGELATVALITAISVYLLRGGTHIVRGILEKGRILPARSDRSIQLDIDEYNRGQVIGNLERLLLLIFVSIQSWSALAFLMAAKGLFRAKDLEKREFSEYFLVGTLVSSLVAIVAGLLVLMTIHLLW